MELHLAVALEPGFLDYRDFSQTLCARRAGYKELRQAARAMAKRHFAAKYISRWWRKLFVVRWLNSVAAQARPRHLWASLTPTNLPWCETDSFGCALPLAIWKRVELVCPACRKGNLEAAHFHFQPCAAQRLPFLHVGCRECVAMDVREWLLGEHVSYVSNLQDWRLLCWLDTID